MAEASNSNGEIQVSMPQVTRFIRQLAHDLRNHLNAAELQSAYLCEIAEDSEMRDELKRLRGMIAQVGITLQNLTVALSPPRLTQMPYAAKDLIEDLQEKVAAAHAKESAEVKWKGAAGDVTLNIDPQSLLPALTEIFANAFRHERAEGPITAQARTENRDFVLTVSEPKKAFQGSTENWGREPLQSLGQGHYGLGLHRTRAIIEAHGGKLTARYDQETGFLITTITLPLDAPGA